MMEVQMSGSTSPGFPHRDTQKRALIAGGSMGGLFTALLLQR
jgi:hypothetical protein